MESQKSLNRRIDATLDRPGRHMDHFEEMAELCRPDISEFIRDHQAVAEAEAERRAWRELYESCEVWLRIIDGSYQGREATRMRRAYQVVTQYVEVVR